MALIFAYSVGPDPKRTIAGIAPKQQVGHMSTTGSRSYPDATRLAEIVQKIRVLKLHLSGIIEHSRNSSVVSRLIMASGLLDIAIEEISKSVSEAKH